MSTTRHTINRRFAADVTAGLFVRRVANAGGQITVNLATDGTLAGGQQIEGCAHSGGRSGKADSAIIGIGPAKAISGAAIDPDVTRLLTVDAQGRLQPANPGEWVVAVYSGKKDVAGADEQIDVFVTALLGISVPYLDDEVATSGTATITNAGGNPYIDVALGAANAGKIVIANLVTAGDGTATHLTVVEDRGGGTYRIYVNAVPTGDVDVDYVCFA